eukprot:COSAG02_NODE_65_length_42645_cov_26.951934_27_plen_167_part_00
MASTMLMVSTAVGGVSSNSLDLSAHSQPGEGWVFPMHDARPDFDWTFKTNDPVDNETAVASLTQTILGVSNWVKSERRNPWYGRSDLILVIRLDNAGEFSRHNTKFQSRIAEELDPVPYLDYQPTMEDSHFNAKAEVGIRITRSNPFLLIHITVLGTVLSIPYLYH